MSTINSILVIDDEANLRQTLTTILQRAGYQVSSAKNGDEACQFLRTGPYGLVFLDLKMPGTDGLTLLPEFRQMYPQMPIFILTAHATINSAIKAVKEGARDYLLKPVDPEQLLERVRNIFSEQQQPQRRREIVSQLQDLLTELHQIEGAEPPDQVADPAPNSDTSRYLYLGSMTIDLHTRMVEFNNSGKKVTIPPSSFNYLIVLVRHSPNPVQFEVLVIEAQGYSMTRAEAREIVRGHIHELRKAIEPDMPHPQFIITVRDYGYRLIA